MTLTREKLLTMLHVAIGVVPAGERLELLDVVERWAIEQKRLAALELQRRAERPHSSGAPDVSDFCRGVAASIFGGRGR